MRHERRHDCHPYHGTTWQRALAILENGPDPEFKEPGELTTAEGISFAPTEVAYEQGEPAIIARGKAALFPREGGPALLEIEMPQYLIDISLDLTCEIRFLRGCGLEELLSEWDNLSKRIHRLQ